MTTKQPIFSVCEQANLANIQARFQNALLLSVAQLAELLQTSANNLSQKLSRGQIPICSVRIGNRPFFPVPLIASWLCGSFEDDAIQVSLPKRTARTVRSSKDLAARLISLKIEVERRAKTLRDADDQNNFRRARAAHEEVSSTLVSEIERNALAIRFGIP